MSILPMPPQPGWENIPGDGSYAEYIMRARMTPREYEEWKRRPPAPSGEPFPEMRPPSPGPGYVPRVIIGSGGQQSQDWVYNPPKDPWTPAPSPPQGPQGPQVQGWRDWAQQPGYGAPAPLGKPWGSAIGFANDILAQRGYPLGKPWGQQPQQSQPWGPGQGAPWRGFFGNAINRLVNRPGAAQHPSYGPLIGRVNELLAQRGQPQAPWWQGVLQTASQQQPSSLARLNQPGYQPQSPAPGGPQAPAPVNWRDYIQT